MLLDPGKSGFHLRGRGGSLERPKTGGGGGGEREKGSIERTINQLLSILAPKAPKTFLSIENGQSFSPNTWQMMNFLNLLDALFPKIP